ncbi:MAG: hypothetical protein AMXMBFR58_33070 [Phycisphaerae bacterium]
MKRILLATVLSLIAGSTACTSTRQDGASLAGPTENGARLYRGVDRYHRPIKTSSQEAQRWYDQGIQFLYAFNHDEAVRSFEEAARHDPASPMPWWGIAYAHGININDPAMSEDRWRLATDAAAEARQRRANASPADQALIDAIGARYTYPPPADPKPYHEAYTAAMRRAYESFPDDPDVASLYAESMMDLQPWDYWTKDGQPRGQILTIVDVLEKTLARYPDHPGACHFYIHAVEASQTPERAIAAADRLRDRVPGAGHLVHMPSHIDVRVGQYAKAADANARATQVDRTYLEQHPEVNYYYLYVAHNRHFLAYAAMMEARYQTAIAAARDLQHAIPDPILRKMAPAIEGLVATHYHVMIRFGKWEDILREPLPPEHLLMTRAVHWYARSIAYSATGRTSLAREEIAKFDEAAAKIPADYMLFNNKVSTIMPIARAMLEGELAFREGRYDEAFESLRQGAVAEDALIYDEPPGWMIPVRHAWGALLMSAKRYDQAEQVYREDLVRNRENGWGLLGLQNALNAQGKCDEADTLSPRIATAWARADVKPTSSCMCEPGQLATR